MEIVNICDKMEHNAFRTAHIQSPGYPVEYGSSLECICNITTDPDQRILLKFADYSLEWSESCDKDVVQVTNISFHQKDRPIFLKINFIHMKNTEFHRMASNLFKVKFR